LTAPFIVSVEFILSMTDLAVFAINFGPVNVARSVPAKANGNIGIVNGRKSATPFHMVYQNYFQGLYKKKFRN